MTKPSSWQVWLLGFLVLVGVMFPAKFVHGSGGAYEVAAIGNLRALGTVLEQFYTVHGHYPDNWLADLYESVEPDLGPPRFAADLQTTPHRVPAYDYQYTPRPAGCSGASCTGYILEATPMITTAWWKPWATQYPARSFFTDESRLIRHCMGTTGADSSDQTIDYQVLPCSD